MGSCAVDRVSVLQGLQVNWEREPSVCHGGWVWQGGVMVWAVCFPCNSTVYHQGQKKTAISNL